VEGGGAVAWQLPVIRLMIHDFFSQAQHFWGYGWTAPLVPGSCVQAVGCDVRVVRVVRVWRTRG
jgi:hypothetical protein